MKMKEFGPPGGRPWRPPLDPPMVTFVLLSQFNSKNQICGQSELSVMDEYQCKVNTKFCFNSHFVENAELYVLCIILNHVL